MENYLYLLEVFVEKITFSSNISDIPKPNDIVISGEVGKFIKVDIFTMHHEIENGSSNEITINCGKSNLFSYAPNDLQKKITDYPLRIVVYIKGRKVGETLIQWDKKFFDLILTSIQSFGVSGPVSFQNTYILKEQETEKIMGDIKLTVKLSSFGTNIQTSYQLINPKKDTKKKYLIRGARGETTFECQKFSTGSSSDLIPVAPFFTSNENEVPPPTYNPPSYSVNFDEEPISWMALFKSTLDPKTSTLPDEFSIAISSMFAKPPVHITNSATTFDIISIVERPEENKFMDLRIRGGSQGLILEVEKIPGATVRKSISSEKSIQSDDITTNRIEKLLCKSKDCPAAKKFKEFGIGPLANVKGLGTLRDDVTPPVTYGLSQTYGVFDEYGPYGLFSRPKRPEDPFVPPNKDSDWAETCWKPKQRKKDQKQNDPNKEHYPPLRLTGGGVLDYDDVNSPLHECKQIMNQFDEILAQYKQAVGPCGQVTCPFAPNVVEETCKRRCQHSVRTRTPKDEKTKQFTLEGNNLVSAEAPNRLAALAACGSTKCPYAKYKTGLIDDDAAMELQYLPSPQSGKCGHPKCPFPVEPELPPIHWDCPDPLPKGRCKNPDCPYLPKEIKCLNEVMNKGPCGNLNCPYSVPKPCASPNCPFSSKECPYHQQEEFGSMGDGQNESICGNPECPYATEKPSPCCMAQSNNANPQQNPCFMPSCPNGMPFCSPFLNPYLQAMLMSYLQAMGCNPNILKLCFGGPDCPYTKNNDKTEPLDQQQQQPEPESTLCQGSVCESKKKSAPTTIEPTTSCNNPTCPYVPIKSPPPPPEDKCANPHCPFADTNETKTSKRIDDEPGELKEGAIERSSDTRIDRDNAPCTKGTCKSRGGELECEECGQGGVCPCNEPEQPSIQSDKECYKTPSPCYVPPKSGAQKPPPCIPNPCMFPPCMPPTCMPPSCMPPSCMPPSCIPPSCTYMMNTLQALIAAFCLPFTICDDPNCLYTAQQVNELMAACFGQAQPCMAPQKDSQKVGEEKEEELKEGAIEYSSDTRVDVDNSPCTQQTCKGHGGELECTECPCGQGDGQQGQDPQEGTTEYKYETREDLDLAPCTRKSCMAEGGTLECDVCPCGEREKTGKKGKATFKGKKGKRKKGKFVYSMGNKYPGVQIGHRECVTPAFNIPRTMGWLWNVFTPCLGLKPRRGWRPGAIGKLIAERIRQHREAQGLEVLQIKHIRFGKKGCGEYESCTSVNVQPKPTLQIKKKDGCYWITMNPLKDPHTLVENESPYMDCTPMQFKIVKNKDKREEIENEYKSCFCGDDEKIVVESSSDSELDIEFTPPAGIIHPERFKKKRNVVHGGTQYLAEDFETKSTKTAASSKKSKKGKKGKDKKGKKGKGKKGKKKK